MITDKLTIVNRETGRKQQRLISWLLSKEADWAMDAAPFMIVDDKLQEKIKDAEFGGRPVDTLLKMKYPYLKTILDQVYEDDKDTPVAGGQSTEATETPKAETTNKKPRRKRVTKTK